jgi:hypothetical protein
MKKNLKRKKENFKKDEIETRGAISNTKSEIVSKSQNFQFFLIFQTILLLDRCYLLKKYTVSV